MITSNNDKKNLNVPPLRFPEFKGEWEKHILSDLAERLDSQRIPVLRTKRNHGNTPYYGANGIQDYVDGYTHDGEFVLVAEDGANDLKNYPVQYVSGKVWVNNHAHVLKAKVGNETLFLKYLISSADIEPFLVGGGRAKLNADTMMKLNFFTPGQKEQQKVDLLLLSIDKRIAAQRKIIEEKEQLKRWVNDACLWNKNFPKIALNKIIKERNLRTTTVHQYRVLSSAVTGLYSQIDYFKHQISSENDIGYKVVLLNDIVFSPQNLWMGNINFNESFETGMVSPSYKVYSVNEGFVPFYLSLFLKTKRMKYEYSICSEQGASIVRRNLNEDEFLQIAIPMPDFKTQVTTAKKLKLIEQNVETEKQYLKLLIKKKSFLLSSLFI